MKSVIKRGLASLLIMVLACSFVVLPSKADTVSKLSPDLTQKMLTSTAFQDVMVVLRDEPVIEHTKNRTGIDKLDTESIKSDSNSSSYENKLIMTQSMVFNKVKQTSPDAEIGHSLTWTLNGFTMKARGVDLSKIADIKEVKAVYPIPVVSMPEISTLAFETPTAGSEDLVLQHMNEEVLTGLHVKDVWQMKDAKGNPIEGSNIVIAVIDTGVDYTHPDLGGCLGSSCKVIGGYDFGDDDSDPMDQMGHGTLVAGTIAADGRIKGTAPKAKLLAYKVLPTLTTTTPTSDVLLAPGNIYPAIDQAAKDGADIINISLTDESRLKTDYGKEIIENLETLNIIVVAAAGNSGSAVYCDDPFSPDLCPKGYSAPLLTTFTEPNVITVGGSVSTDMPVARVAPFSSMGPSIDFRLKPDLIAPAYTFNTATGSRYVYEEGTSFSTPLVSGIAALIKQGHPDWSTEDVRASLINTATVFYNDDNEEPESLLLQGSGRVDALRALETSVLVEPYSISMTATGLKPVNLVVKNVSGTTQTLSASVELTLGNFELGANDGLKLSISPSTLTIPKGGSATVTLIPSADLTELSKGPHEGLVWLSNGETKAHVPLLIWNDPSAWWFPVTETRPSKLANVRASSTVLDFSIPEQRTVTIDFTLRLGSIDGPAALVDTPTTIPYGYLMNSVSLVEISILDENNATVTTFYAETGLLIGHYKAVWNGLGEDNFPVKDGKYKYVIAASDSGISVKEQQYVYINVDTASGYIQVKNSPDTTPPSLTVNIPEEYTVTKYVFEPDPVLVLSGKTEAGNFVEINGESVAVDSSGMFKANIPLTTQVNKVTVIARRKVLDELTLETWKLITIQLVPLNLIELQIGKPQFKVNNQTKILDAPPIIKNSRTLLPIRAVVEAMGGQVEWDPADRRVDITYEGKSINLWIGKNKAKVNGQEVMIDPSNPNVVPEITNSRTMVPLRFVAESLGCHVEWLPNTKSIRITYQAG